ncbi:MAG: DUF4270 domain-containing protein [Bacteroidales bacterium]|nr:DUF4270 domain-containing protein [Bacteroidales bacterium]
MNKFFYNFSALFLACFALSCSNDENMGLDIMPDGDIPNILITDTIDIKAYTVPESHINTSNQSYLMVGNTIDPIFGKSSATFCAKFSNNAYKTITEGAICDSVILSLGLDTTDNYFYGDKEVKSSIEVYKLTKELNYDDETFYSDHDISNEIEKSPISSITFIPSELDTLINFVLPVEYGQDALNHVATKTFDDNVYGLYFAPSSSNESNCILKTSHNNIYTKYTVYYHYDKDTAESYIDFSISDSDTRINMFNHDYSNTNIDINNQSDTLLYLQSMCGTKLKLDVSDIKKFLKYSPKYVVINRAQLYLPLADNSISLADTYSPINDIVCLGEKNNGETYTFNEYIVTTSSGSSTITTYLLDTTNNQYSVNLTGRVDDILKLYNKGLEPEYDIFIYSYGRAFDFDRSVINSPTKSVNPMRLIVEYTVFDK